MTTSTEQPPVIQDPAEFEGRAFLLHLARTILLAVPPRAALATVLEVFEGLSEFKAPDGVELVAEVAIVKRTCAAVVKGTESLPESVYEISEDDDWTLPLVAAVARTAPGAPGSVLIACEMMLKILGGAIPPETLSIPPAALVVPEDVRKLANQLTAYFDQCSQAARKYVEGKIAEKAQAASAPTSSA